MVCLSFSRRWIKVGNSHPPTHKHRQTNDVSLSENKLQKLSSLLHHQLSAHKFTQFVAKVFDLILTNIFFWPYYIFGCFREISRNFLSVWVSNLPRNFFCLNRNINLFPPFFAWPQKVNEFLWHIFNTNLLKNDWPVYM